ncbi:MAG: VOC family protein [Gammaproteobacteria bacterium]
MRIEHIALWTEDIERLVHFYSKYFNGTAAETYVNAAKGFESRFLSFEGGARLELMKSSKLEAVKHARGAQRMGLTHLAVSVGGESGVDEVTNRLRRDGYDVVDGPRRTGDGYYESVILDPDGNRIEIAA